MANGPADSNYICYCDVKRCVKCCFHNYVKVVLLIWTKSVYCIINQPAAWVGVCDNSHI